MTDSCCMRPIRDGGSHAGIRGLVFRSGRAALHLVSVFACKSRLVLGQLSGAPAGDEIAAVAQLLGMMRLHGAIVTADALHCQRDTAALIRRKGGDHVLACKGNQGSLLEDIRLFMEDEETVVEVHEETDAGHGRT